MRPIVLGLLLGLIGVIMLSLYSGPIHFYLWQFHYDSILQILYLLKIERIISGCLVGAILAMSGLLLQNLLKNPIVDPYILGISSGAGVGVAIALLLGSVVTLFTHSQIVILMAFIGAMSSALALFILARQEGKIHLTRLLLMGMALTFFESAVIQLIVSLNSTQNMPLYLWLMGSLSATNGKVCIALAAMAVLLWGWMRWQHHGLDLFLLGEEVAQSSGVSVEQLKIVSTLLVAFSMAIMVTYCGIIGFVGMMVPHMVRKWVGPTVKKAIIPCVILGAIFIVFSDFLATVVIYPSELPLGAMIAIIGAPYFIIVCWKGSR